jgi:23S rRNA (cytidine1920-2'-O)/16S rRNA (cytidine1409-2'-O)-methyltransferase
MKPKKSKSRLDIFLFSKNLSPSPEAAAREIMAGNVFVNGVREDKPGFQVCEEERDGKISEPVIEIKERALKYVSRGALKLAKAAEVWGIDFTGKVVADIGASTGGFTDFAIKNGAEKIYAIDVGYGQLDYSLRKNEKVFNMERTNVRYLFEDKKTGAKRNENLCKSADIVLIDISFISLKHALPVAARLLKDDGEIIALIKPQFEARKEQVERGGLIRDEKVHKEVIERVKSFTKENDLTFDGLIESPVKGAKGNKEFLMRSQKKRRSV